MIPGNSQILTCPFCGGEKEILSPFEKSSFPPLGVTPWRPDA